MSGNDVIEMALGKEYTCALFQSGYTKCFGAVSIQYDYDDPVVYGDEPGEMGENLPFMDLGTTFTSIKGGLFSFCGLTADGKLKCFGDNKFLQLGQGTNVQYVPDQASLPFIDFGPGLLVTDFAVGQRHVCALLDDATVKCFGYNGGAQLGYEGVAANLGDAGHMGANLPAVDISEDVVHVYAGGEQTCALTVTNKLHCWGANYSGRLGIGIDGATRFTYGGEVGDMGNNLPIINLGANKNAKFIAMGARFTCAILNDDTTKCWGENSSGQLGYKDANGNPFTQTIGDTLSDMGDNLPALDLGTGLYALSLTISEQATCAILNNNKVKCWGQNASGILGLGDFTSYTGQMGDSLPFVPIGTGLTATKIFNHYSHTCVILDTSPKKVKCWGEGTKGKLGQGTTSNIGDGEDEMGDNLPIINLGSGTPVSNSTNSPTLQAPTKTPTKAPITENPTKSPITENPTKSPSSSPITSEPTTAPVTSEPTTAPVTLKPSASPFVAVPTKSPTNAPTFATALYTPLKADCAMITDSSSCESETNSECGGCLFFSDKVGYGFRVRIDFVMDGNRRFSDFESTSPSRTTFRDALKALLQKHLQGDRNIQINRIGQINQVLNSNTGHVFYDIYFIDNISSKSAAKDFFASKDDLSDYVDELNEELNKRMRTTGRKYITGSVSISSANILDLANGKGFCACPEDVEAKAFHSTLNHFIVTLSVLLGSKVVLNI